MNNERLRKFQIFADLTNDELGQFHDSLKKVEIKMIMKQFVGRKESRNGKRATIYYGR